MKIIENLQKLDDLIVEHTQPPAQTVMRNHLHLALQQTEAQDAEMEKLKKLLKEHSEQLATKTKQIDEFVAASKLHRHGFGIPPFTSIT